MIGFGRMSALSGGPGTSDHALLSHLSYATAGHTGFAPTAHSHPIIDYFDVTAGSSEPDTPSAGKSRWFHADIPDGPNIHQVIALKLDDGSVWPIVDRTI